MLQPGAYVPTATRQHGEERQSPARTWVADPPPFGVSSDRFAREGRSGSPEYHVAYRDVVQPPRWTAKGWVGMDDYIKPRRGTAPSVYGTSSLVPPAAPPRHTAGLAPLAAPCPNETRLQELLGLQRRKLHTEPGPGAYEPRAVSQRRRFRRQHDPEVDGPHFLEHMQDGPSTRVKEIAALLRAKADSGLGPGEYDGQINKDRVMRSAPAARVGTSDRDGRTQHAKSLSISRSIQHGIDWHVPVIVQPPLGAASMPGAAAAAAGISSSADGDAAGESGGNAAGVTADARPTTAERSPALYGGSSSGGGGSRDTSPSGRGAAADQYLGVPPPPPSQVSRGMRRQQERRPGDWDWNRLGKNYRTGWTTLHGGAYTQGDHPIPRPPQGSVGASGVVGSGPSHSSPAVDPHTVQGIYPIAEESSGALEGNSSRGSIPVGQQGQGQYGSSGSGQYQQQLQQQQQRHQQQQLLQQQQQQQQLYAQQQMSLSQTGGSGGGGYGAWEVSGGARAAPGALQPVGPGGPVGMTVQPTGKLRSLVSEEDLRRRRAALALAAQAQHANGRVNDWQSKFAG